MGISKPVMDIYGQHKYVIFLVPIKAPMLICVNFSSRSEAQSAKQGEFIILSRAKRVRSVWTARGS